MGKTCAVPKCNVLHKMIKRSMFKVPFNEIDKKKWAAALPEIKKLKASHRICEKHFDDAFIIRKYEKYDLDGKLIAEHTYRQPRLDRRAIPNTPANIATVQLAVHPENANSSISLSPDRENSVSSVLLSADSQQSSSSIELSADSQNCALSALVSADPEKHLVRQFSADSQSSTSSALFSANSLNCVSSVSFSVDSGNADIGSDLMNVNLKTSFSLNGLCIGENLAFNVPKPWLISEIMTELGMKVIFSHVITLSNNDTTPVLKKSVAVDLWNGRIHYYVHGIVLNFDENTQLLPRVLENIEALSTILLKFECMRICKGITSIEIFVMKENAIKDSLNYWRDIDCSLLTKYKKCDACKKHKILKQRQVRNSKNRIMNRIRYASNPRDQGKILTVLKKKTYPTKEDKKPLKI